jgi:hypothetical protein
MSMPLIACMTTPRRPYCRVRVNIFCQRNSIISGSSPISSGARSFWIAVALLPPAGPDSPMPVMPASVSISTSSPPRRDCTPAALA